MMRPVVGDFSHNNAIFDASRLKAAGMIGVIHKASQGVGMTDNKFVPRRAQALGAGLLWGRYSFASNDDGKHHADHMLAVGGPPAANELCALDFEDVPHSAHQMSAQEAWDFMREVEDKIGRMCWLYGSNRIPNVLAPFCRHNTAARDYFAARPLWLAQYRTGLGDVTLETLKPHIRVPFPWHDWTLLQYTGDNLGPLPHTIAGAGPGNDLDVFNGTDDQLRAAWAGAQVH